MKAGDVVEGRYRILDILGEGGMGTVFLAEHALIKRRVAIKILHPELATDANVIERFMNEARAAGTLGMIGTVRVASFVAALGIIRRSPVSRSGSPLPKPGIGRCPGLVLARPGVALPPGHTKAHPGLVPGGPSDGAVPAVVLGVAA